MFSAQSLILLIFTPLIAALIIFCPLFPNMEKTIRRFAKWFSVIHFLYALSFFIYFQSQNPMLVIEEEMNVFSYPWLEVLGISATFSMDSLSLVMVLLTSFIFFIAFLMSKKSIKKDFKLYYFMMLLLETSILGIFCAKDMFLFFLLWELELVPMYFLISKWGSENAKYSAMKFILYTFFGSIFLLVGILTIYFHSYFTTGILTANMDMMDLESDFLSYSTMLFTFICFLIGFGVKLPIIPLHTWLIDAHSDAPTPVSIVLAAILLKTGAYGLLRFNLSMFPEIFTALAPVLMIFAVINCIFASCCAIVQKDIKRLIAYSSISQMGIFMIGLFSLSFVGLSGGIFQLVSHAFIVTGLFTIAGIIYSVYKTRDITEIQKNVICLPNLAFFSTPIILAAAGVPLMSGFIAEFYCFVGGFTSEWTNLAYSKLLTTIALFTIVLSSVYILKLFHGIFFGCSKDGDDTQRDVSGHRLSVLIIISVIVVAFGIFPDILTEIYTSFIETTTDLLGVQ